MVFHLSDHKFHQYYFKYKLLHNPSISLHDTFYRIPSLYVEIFGYAIILFVFILHRIIYIRYINDTFWQYDIALSFV